MPAERKSLRGRTRSKTRGQRGVRSRLTSTEAGCSAENPAAGPRPSGSGAEHQAVMAAAPQAGWQASLRGLGAETLHCLVKMWAYRRVWMLVFSMLLLLCYLRPGFLNSLSPSKSILWSNETANGQSLEKTSVSEAVFSFFFPTTCIPKENQVVKPCNKLQDFNESECLRNKCCYSSVKTSNFSCFAPLKDKPTQMFRMFGFVVISMISLGCLPIYCCSFCRRSRWANPLRRKVSRLLKGLKKQRSNLNRDAEMLGAGMDEEGLDDEKEETKALFSH
ncbi:FMR1 neighbor protein isoform X1 [Vicugna pacos]|uniref:FMR1 neighbor protein isoform X1 n=1 Tax=Vicugna pacos TaxID=30538 RepID=A0A6J3A2G6_VICPA